MVICINSHALRCGIAGFGKYGHWHVNECRLMPKLRGRIKFIAGFDPNFNNQNHMKKHKIEPMESFDQLINNQSLEAIIIASPPSEHGSQIIKSLERGLHTYCEVPMTLEINKIEKIIDAEEKSGKKFQFGENYCFFPEILYSSHMIGKDKFGPIVSAEMEFMIDEGHKGWINKNSDIKPHHKCNWFSKFPPLMYGHSILPAQVAISRKFSPVEFNEVFSKGNSLSDRQKNPLFKGNTTFQQSLFSTEENTIVKCTNSYILPKRGSEISLRVLGKFAYYKVQKIGKFGHLFSINNKNGILRDERIGWFKLHKYIKPEIGDRHGANTRILDNWLNSIEKDEIPILNARAVANSCEAGIKSKISLEENRNMKIKSYT